MNRHPVNEGTPSDPDARLLFEMVSIASLTGHERPLAEHLSRAMHERGMDAHIDPAGNAVGIVGSPDEKGRSIDIVLLGHMDTVPGDIPVRIEGDTLHGRGSVDAKGPLATFVCAASRANVPPGVRLIVIGAVEEEAATSRGALQAIKSFTPAACVIGEPSGWDGVTLGYKGRLLVEYEERRASAHAAGPGTSVGDDLCRWWDRVRTRAESERISERAFERVQATMRRMGTSSDGLYERATALGGFRLPPGVTAGRIEAICREEAGEHVRLGFTGAEVAHVCDRNNPVARALTGAIRGEGGTPHPKHKTGTSDMNVVGPVWGCPISAYGPGDSALDHTPEERISLREYARAIRVLTLALESLAAELAGVEAACAR